MFYWNIARSIWTLRNFYKRQQLFTKPFLESILADVPERKELDKKAVRRMHDYPTLFIVLYVELFAQLRQKPLTAHERARLTLFSASGALYDDFFDEANLDEKYILEIYQNPEKIHIQTSQDKVFQVLQKNFYQYFPATHQNFADFQATFVRFCNFQQASKAQLKPERLSPEALRQISFGKGGTALLLSRYLLDNPPSEAEAQTVEAMGAWFQWFDDIVDIAQDRRKHAQTLILNTTDIQQASQEIRQITQDLFAQMRLLPYPAQIMKKVLNEFFVISTTGWVHLNRLAKLQKSTGGIFTPEKYTEQDILWREDKPENIWIALQIWAKESL